MWYNSQHLIVLSGSIISWLHITRCTNATECALFCSADSVAQTTFTLSSYDLLKETKTSLEELVSEHKIHSLIQNNQEFQLGFNCSIFRR